MRSLLREEWEEKNENALEAQKREPNIGRMRENFPEKGIFQLHLTFMSQVKKKTEEN